MLTLVRLMNDDAIRDRVLLIFSRHRACPEESFDEAHFLDFFLRNPAGKKRITANSFAGLRRRNHFIQEVEQEFLVCFGTKDFDRNFSLQDFVKRIAELQSSPRSSQGALRARLNAGSGWGALVVIDFVLLFVALAARRFWWLAAIPAILALAFTLWAGSAILGSRRRDRELARRLNVTAR